MQSPADRYLNEGGTQTRWCFLEEPPWTRRSGGCARTARGNQETEYDQTARPLWRPHTPLCTSNTHTGTQHDTRIHNTSHTPPPHPHTHTPTHTHTHTHTQAYRHTITNTPAYRHTNTHTQRKIHIWIKACGLPPDHPEE